MKTIEQIEKETNGKVYDFDTFLEHVMSRSIISYDGGGCFHDGENETSASVDVDELYFIFMNHLYDNGFDEDDLCDEEFEIELPDSLKEMKDKYPYVIWFNR
jgi:hypothetical protein